MLTDLIELVYFDLTYTLDFFHLSMCANYVNMLRNWFTYTQTPFLFSALFSFKFLHKPSGVRVSAIPIDTPVLSYLLRVVNSSLILVMSMTLNSCSSILTLFKVVLAQKQVTDCGQNFLINSMLQSPSWAANGFAASQEIPQISRNPKVHYRTPNVRHLSL